MGRKSSIDCLPKELRQKLLSLLKNPAVTQIEITELINREAGESVVSKSSVNRYAIRMQKQIEKTKQAREVAETYINELGGETQNKMGKVLNEQIRLIAYDLISDIEEMKQSGKVAPSLIVDLVFKVSRGLKNLEEAEKLNADRADKIRKEALDKAADKTEKTLKKEGLSKEAILQIKKDILGLS